MGQGKGERGGEGKVIGIVSHHMRCSLETSREAARERGLTALPIAQPAANDIPFDYSGSGVFE